MEVNARFLFKLPFSIQRKGEHGNRPKCIQTSSEEIMVYPPAKYEYSLFEKPLWSPDPKQAIGKVNGELVWKADCIPIHIRKTFTSIPITDENQQALVTTAREILYKLLTLYRWRGGQLQVTVTDIENLNYDLRYFDSTNKLINAGPGGSTGISQLNVSLMPFKPIAWNDISQQLVSGAMPELYENLILDAYAVAPEEPRRAILDAATACEVFIKKFCYDTSQNNPKVDPIVYSALTTRNIPLLSYFHEVLKYLLKHSLQEEKTKLYQELDCLVRTNNSVKHEGLCRYRNDKGRFIQVDLRRAREFIKAVEHAIEYTKSLAR
jgi:hypothetical protein